MDCKRTQQLIGDLSKDRLPESVAREVRLHLADCTDCRVLEQRAARLQRLLALKRYEQPVPGYHENFLAEFHRRLEAKQRSRAALWTRIVESLTLEPARVWRYGFAATAGVALMAGVTVMSLRAPQQPLVPMSRPVARVTEDRPTPPPSPAQEAPPERPSAIETALVQSPRSAASDDEFVEPLEPSYALDRVTIIPVGYEVASIRF